MDKNLEIKELLNEMSIIKQNIIILHNSLLTHEEILEKEQIQIDKYNEIYNKLINYQDLISSYKLNYINKASLNAGLTSIAYLMISYDMNTDVITKVISLGIIISSITLLNINNYFENYDINDLKKIKRWFCITSVNDNINNSKKNIIYEEAIINNIHANIENNEIRLNYLNDELNNLDNNKVLKKEK